MRSESETDFLLDLQRVAWRYFAHETSLATGLVRDKTEPGWPASIAAVGLGLTGYPIAVERGLIDRTEAVERVLATLRFFWTCPQGTDPRASGYRGFFYHFLDMRTGTRSWRCELSTIDTALLLAGVLTVACYFERGTDPEREIRDLADRLYARVDWSWALNGGSALSHGWKPETGFLPYRWQGYDEALILYVLALGSPTHPISADCYAEWTSSYRWVTEYGLELLYAGPLFTHQLSHGWIDFRGIQDPFMRDHGSDYFENSRRATLLQQRYATHNPHDYLGYGPFCWGITASDGPGDVTCSEDGRTRRFHGYLARGVPHGPDDGTLAPWSVVASLPFAPDLVIPTLHHFRRMRLPEQHRYGYTATFNPTFPHACGKDRRWTSRYHYGLNQGPIVMMVENFRTGLIWQLTRSCPAIVTGLRRAGFTGGWL